MIARIFTFVLAVGFSLGAVAQNGDTAFQRQWLDIDTLIIKNDLTKTALSKVEAIYQKAKQRQLHDHVVKTLIYRFSLESRITDNNPDKSINRLRTEIAAATDPVQKSILHSLLATQYRNYYYSNRWRSYNRAQTSEQKKDSIATWSIDDLVKATTKSFLSSIANKSILQQKKIDAYEAVIIAGNARKLRPTLYDLLAHEALDFFKTGESFSTAAVNTYILNDPSALGTIKEFLAADFSTKDSTSKWQALRLFKELITFHNNDADKNALINVNLERIEWVNSVINTSNKEVLHTQALEEITKKYAALPESAQAWYELAELQNNKANTYQPFADTTNRYGHVKAKQIIDQALQLYSQPNQGTVNMRRLLAQILQKDLATRTERVNVSGKPFRALISYRNINKVYARIIKLGEGSSLYENRYNQEFWKKAITLPVYKTFTQSLPDTKDYQLHNVELKIDQLPIGEYILLTCEKESFIDSTDKLSAQQFYVSNLAFVQNQSDFFILDRDNGKPVPGAKVDITLNNLKKTYTKTSDKNGYLNFPIPKNTYNIDLVVTKAHDKLAIKNSVQAYYDYGYEDDEKNNDATKYEVAHQRMFFFTDRSIYRPGQTIFFKGIGVTEDYKSKLSKIVSNKKTGWLYLQDATFKKIDSLSFTLNEYGSFNGSFQLPQNMLTGNFSFQLSEYAEMNQTFKVEEYKRPTFSVAFDKKKGAYRLNDSITITGSVTAYAGNLITDAKVVYNVQRSSRFLDPWYRPRITTGARQIKQGEIKTDQQGKFSITFKALADDIIDKSGNPVFDFRISADVTDISGETRSESTSLSIGFSAIQLKLSVPQVIQTDSLKKIGIASTNMDNQHEPSVVRVKIFSLQAPEKTIRKRYWQRPDQFVMSKSEFSSYFPTDEYEEETNLRNWATKELVKEETIDTKDKNGLSIAANTLKPGFYRIEAVTTDKYGEEAKAVQYTQLFSLSGNDLPLSKFNYTVKNSVEPGDTAQFINGIFADQLFFIRRTEREKSKTGKYEFLEKNKGYETISYTADEKDRGNVRISEAFVYDNRVYTQSYLINVPWSNKALTVQYETYRDKTEPGAKEKWTVSVQNDKNGKASAELLTAMYDASLDQFQKHNWLSPDIWQSRSWSSNFTSYTNFNADNSISNYINEKYFADVEVVYDRFATDAYELARTRLSKRLNEYANLISREDRQRLQLFAAPLERSMSNQRLEGRVAGLTLDEVVQPTIGYGAQKTGLRDAAATVQIRGVSSPTAANAPLYVVDGVVMEEGFIPAENIGTLTILNSSEAAAIYGDRAANGVILINTKGTTATPPVVTVRKNFNETAFFFPQLYADSTGKYSFSFTMPESLTQWKWISLAHTKELAFGTNSATITAQKKLMVQANAPRFMREGDNMEFSGKIVNMTEKEMTGQVILELIDPVSNTSVDGWFQNVFPVQYFTVEAGQSFAVKFPILIPFSYNRPLTWRIKAIAGDVSDGEENTLPVLTNRMLVTETLPLFLPNDTTQSFAFEKLKNNKSESLTHEAITVEYSSNPVWYAVQALPYLMEYPYECAEQTFNRLYANALASYIVNKHPKLKKVFEQWKADSSSLKSNLQKNEELKQILLQETPWVLQAESEAQQHRNISLLFDLVKISTQTEALAGKLRDMQLPNGSFAWFKGGSEDRYITNYILTGIGKLKRLGALSPDLALRMRNILANALKYADGKMAEDYNWLIKNKADLAKQTVSGYQIDYLFMRSFFRDISVQPKKEYDYYFNQAKKDWIKQSTYYRAKLGLIYLRNNEEKFAAETILPALIENTVVDSKQGMYWKSTYTGFWYQSPIEHQSLMIAFMSELNLNKPDATLIKNINAMKTWLLLNKQTNNWRTTIATADACYALLLNGTDWLDAEKTITIQLGKTTVSSENGKAEAGTGYFKKRIEGKNVSPEMGNVIVSVTTKGAVVGQTINNNQNTNTSPSWGNIYWQYFEDLDKITPAVTPLSLTKKIFIQRNTDKGVVLAPVKDNEELKTGDKVIIRLELRSDRDMEYLHLKDMRAASMEPVNVLSGYKWQDGLGYYESTKDASTNFFIDHLRKGTYVFDYPLFITHTGIFSVGVASIQCMYAPEFTSHSAGIKIRVAK